METLMIYCWAGPKDTAAREARAGVAQNMAQPTLAPALASAADNRDPRDSEVLASTMRI